MKEIAKKKCIRQNRCPVLIEMIVLALASLIVLALPVVGYTYNENLYTLQGLHFLTGTVISGGTVQVAPSVFMWLLVICAVVMTLLALLVKKTGRKAAGIGIMITSAAEIACAIIFSMQVENALSLEGAKRVGVQYGHLLVVGLGVLAFTRGMHLLYQEGILKRTFDMATLAVAALASMALPFATYTYKKVSHPYTGFDMLTSKEVATDVNTSVSVLAIIIVACAVLLFLLALFADLHRRRNAVVSLVLSAAIIVCDVAASVSVEGMLEGAKSPSAVLASVLPALFAAMIFVRGLYLLYKAKVLSALDFMMVPGLLYLLINNYLPMVGILLAFKKIDYSVGIWASPWCGFDNFRYLFSTKDALIITRNTLLYNLAFIVIGIFTGLVVGICLFAVTKKVVQTFFQTSILLPQLISMIVVAYIVYAFLSNEAGWINSTLFPDSNVNYYSQTGLWPFLLVFINNWKQLGYNAIIFLSSIVGIDRTLYEAAQVDGCGAWKQITKITIPQLKPTIITLFLLQIGKVFYSDFGLFYQVPLDSGILYNVTNTIDTYVYRSLMVLNNISSSSAASAFQSVCGFVLVFVVNLIVRKVDRENALF